MPDESSIFYKAGEALKEHLGSVSMFASRQEMLDNKARIHAFEGALYNAGISIGNGFQTNMASKVSLGVVNDALQSLIDLRATTVSLANTEENLEGLIDLRATKVSLSSAQEAIQALIDLRATQVSLSNTKDALEDLIDLRATKVSLFSTKEALEDLIDLKASKVSLGNATELLATKVSLGNAVTDLQNQINAIPADAGDSAYDVAVTNGFVGTEAEWLTSLRGADGADGAQGPQGIPGTDGVDGLNGADGAVGPAGPPGPAGQDGADGQDGLPGTVGPMGPPGPTGFGASAFEVAQSNGFTGTEVEWLNSLKGADGADGADGAQGVPGADGADGATGPAGADGVDGVDGVGIQSASVNLEGRLIVTTTSGSDIDAGYVIGPQGIQGEDGARGDDGVDGGIGPEGPAGSDGADGLGVKSADVNASGNLIITLTDDSTTDAGYVIGPAGADGATGPAGADGADGANGQDGANGTDGDSAYQVWLNAGNSGTEQDFLDSLKGADGTNGVDGTNGTNGVDGADGDSAYQVWIGLGNTGSEQDFLDSLKGADGADGADGANGTNGADGIDGTNGTNGVDGADGDSAYQVWLNAGNSGTEQDFLDSLKGADGANGADGADGADGAAGQDILSYATTNLPSGSPQGTMAFNITLGKLVYYKNTAWYTLDNNTLVTGTTPKVMCVGDSITVGYTDNPSWTLPFRHGYREGIFNRMGTSIDFVGGSNEPTSTGTPDIVPALVGTADPLISSSSVLELYVGAQLVDSNGTTWEIVTKNSATEYVIRDNGTQYTYLYDTSNVNDVQLKSLQGAVYASGAWNDTNKTVTYNTGLVWTYQIQSTQTLTLYQNNFFVDTGGVSYSITSVGSNNSYTLTKNEDGTEYPLSISATSIDFNNGAKTGIWNDAAKQMEFSDGSIWKYQLWDAIATAGQGGHRGYGGQTISYIRDNIASYISTDNPDIILLLIGINGGTTSELDTLVSNIFTAKPGVKLIVAELTPRATFDASITVLNNYITGTLVPAYKNQGRIIESVDLYSMFLDSNGNIDSTKLSNGANHPTNIMYDQMAKKWVEAINSILY